MTVQTKKLTQGFSEARVQINSFSSGIKQASTGVIAAFSKIALAIGAVVVAAKTLQNAVLGPIQLAAQAEQASVAFEVLAGSAKEAQKIVADLNKFSDVTPFEPEPVKQAGRQLLAFGVEAKNLLPTLNALGNIAAGVGAPLEELAEIYGKIRVQGRVFAEDINQLQGRGINVTKELAKQFGVTTEEVRELVSEGKIGFVEISKALEALAGGDFAGLMQKQSTTVLGLWSTLVGRVKQIGKEFGNEIIDAIGLKDFLNDAIAAFSSLDNLRGYLEPLKEFFGQIREGIPYIQHWFKLLSSSALGKLLPSLQQAGKFMSDLTPILWQGVNVLVAWQSAILDLAVSIPQFLYSISPLGNLIEALGFKIEDFSITWEDVWNGVVETLIFVEFTITNFGKIWEGIFLNAKLAMYAFADDVTFRFRQFVAMIDLYVQAFRDTIQNIPKILENLNGSSIFPWAEKKNPDPSNPLGEIFKGTKWDNFTNAEQNFPFLQEYSQATKEAAAEAEAAWNGHRDGIFTSFERFRNNRWAEITMKESEKAADGAESSFADSIGKISYGITNQIPAAWREAAQKIKEGLKTPLQQFEEDFKQLFDLKNAGLISDEELGLQSLKILPDTVKDAIEGAKTPIEKFKDAGNALKEYFDSGLLSAEQYKIALSKIQQETFGQQQFAGLAEFGSDAAYKSILRNKTRNSQTDPVKQLTDINKQQLNTLNQLPPILRLLTKPPTVVTF